jgi:hypothetical protein
MFKIGEIVRLNDIALRMDKCRNIKKDFLFKVIEEKGQGEVLIELIKPDLTGIYSSVRSIFAERHISKIGRINL